MLVQPLPRRAAIVRLRRLAMTWGALPVRTRDLSSPWVTSRTFSGVQTRANWMLRRYWQVSA